MSFGFETLTLKPLIDVVPASHDVWQWPRAFIHVGLRRLVDLGRLTPERSAQIWSAFVARESSPHTLMITPAVLEIIPVRKL